MTKKTQVHSLALPQILTISHCLPLQMELAPVSRKPPTSNDMDHLWGCDLHPYDLFKGSTSFVNLRLYV